MRSTASAIEEFSQKILQFEHTMLTILMISLNCAKQIMNCPDKMKEIVKYFVLKNYAWKEKNYVHNFVLIETIETVIVKTKK